MLWRLKPSISFNPIEGMRFLRFMWFPYKHPGSIKTTHPQLVTSRVLKHQPFNEKIWGLHRHVTLQLLLDVLGFCTWTYDIWASIVVLTCGGNVIWDSGVEILLGFFDLWSRMCVWQTRLRQITLFWNEQQENPWKWMLGRWHFLLGPLSATVRFFLLLASGSCNPLKHF